MFKRAMSCFKRKPAPSPTPAVSQVDELIISLLLAQGRDTKRLETLMGQVKDKLAELKADLGEMRTVVDGVRAFVATVISELNDLKAQLGDTPAANDIQEFIDTVQAEKGDLANLIATQPGTEPGTTAPADPGVETNGTAPAAPEASDGAAAPVTDPAAQPAE